MQLTNKLQLPEPIVAVCESDYEPTPNRYSVTTLMKPTGQAILQRKHNKEIVQDVSQMTWAMFGKMFHSMLEEAEVEGFKEMRLEAPILGATVSGILDYYNPETQTVHDYKTTTVYKYKNQDFDDYKQQLEGYAYLLAVNGYPVKKLEADLVFRDFQKTKAAFEAGYPQSPIVAITWDFSPCALPRVKQWMEERIRLIKRYEDVPDDQMPVCTPAERWHEPDMWRVLDKGKKRALKRCFSQDEALAYIDQKGRGYIEFTQGKDKRCDDYCSVRGWCPYAKEMDSKSDRT